MKTAAEFLVERGVLKSTNLDEPWNLQVTRDMYVGSTKRLVKAVEAYGAQASTPLIKNDPALYIAWQANIAMAFQDEYAREMYKAGHDHLEGFKPSCDIHEIANNAAKNFLDLLIS